MNILSFSLRPGSSRSPKFLLFFFLGHLLATLLALPAFATTDSPADAAGVVASAAEIDYPPFSYVNEQGRADGFSVELFKAALAAMQRQATFRTGPWSEVRGWLQEGVVEALPLVGRTPEREQLFDFTFPYMTLHGAIVVREGTDDIASLADLEGRQVAVMKGDNAEEFLRREERGIIVAPVATFEVALAELAEGRHDAVVMQRLVALRLLQKTGLDNLRILPRPVEDFRQDFCFAVREGDRETLSLLNEGLALVMADGTFRHLHAKWFASLELPAGRKIVIGGDRNFPPFEFLDEQGRPQGFNVDLTRAIAEAIDLDVEIRLGPWLEVRQALAEGDIDALQGEFYTTRRDLRFDFTAPYLVPNYVVVGPADPGPLPQTLTALQGKRIALQRGDYIHDYLEEQKLPEQIVLVPSMEDALRLVTLGNADYALVSRLTALYLIEKHGWDDLEMGRTPLTSVPYAYAVPEGQQALLTLLAEGLNIVEESGRYQAIYQKWFGLESRPSLAWAEIVRYALYVLIPLTMLLLASLFWSWSQRRQVRLKTAELREREEKYRLLADNTIDTIYMASPDLEFTYVNPACYRLTGYTPEELIGTSLADYLQPDKLAEIRRIIAGEVARGPAGSGVSFETEFLGKHGELVQIEVHGRVIFDDRDRPVNLQGTARDISDRKKAENRLRSSETLLRMSQRISSIGGWEWDLQEDKILVTDEMYRLHDIDPGALPPGGRERLERSLACYAPEDQPRIREAVKRCRSEGLPYQLDCRFITARGRQLWVRSAGEPVFQEGQITKVYGTLQDITAAKQAEEQLRRRSEFIQTILDNLPIGLAVNSLDAGKASYMNRRFEEIYGWPAEELPDIETFFEKVYPDPAYREEIRRRVANDIASGDPEQMDWEDIEVTGRDGGKRIVHAKNIPIYDQGIMISTVQDITSRKSAQAALKESVEQFRLLVEGSPEAIIVETRWFFTYLNPAAIRLFGADSATQLLGQPILERIVAERRADFSRRLEAVEAGEKDLTQVEETCLTLNDQPVPVEISAVPVRYRGQDGSLIFITDVSERHEREQANRELQEQLNQAQKMESMGRLAGGVAHDYNNMLGVIIGYSELVLQKIEPESPLREDIEEILRAAKRSSNITRQLLAFARQQTAAPRLLNLNETVESMLKMLRRLIGEDIELRWQPGNPLWTVRIDPSQVDQILANLCVNARDAIDNVGSLVIETRNARFDETDVTDRAELLPGEYVMLAVSDTGPGMAAETREKIFEPFFTTKGLGEGTGLGLATVYGIVRQNEGFINVYSEPGQGSTFKIYLPRARQELDEEGVKEQQEDLSAARGETILLVEDELSILRLGESMLRALGYRIFMASSPDEALALPEQKLAKVDLVLTDVIMPKMHGRELVEQLRMRRPGLKALYMSGYPANVIAERGVLQEDLDFLQKPFSIQELAGKVRESLDRN